MIDAAIVARLGGLEVINATDYPLAVAAQAVIAANLTADPDLYAGAGGPAIYNGSAVQGVKPKCVTFRANGGARLDLPGADYANVYYDFEVWDSVTGGELIGIIEEAVSRLLDSTRNGDDGLPIAPVLPVSVGHVYHGRIVVPLIRDYDANHNAHSGLIRYEFTRKR